MPKPTTKDEAIAQHNTGLRKGLCKQTIDDEKITFLLEIIEAKAQARVYRYVAALALLELLPGWKIEDTWDGPRIVNASFNIDGKQFHI